MQCRKYATLRRPRPVILSTALLLLGSSAVSHDAQATPAFAPPSLSALRQQARALSRAGAGWGSGWREAKRALDRAATSRGPEAKRQARVLARAALSAVQAEHAWRQSEASRRAWRTTVRRLRQGTALASTVRLPHITPPPPTETELKRHRRHLRQQQRVLPQGDTNAAQRGAVQRLRRRAASRLAQSQRSTRQAQSLKHAAARLLAQRPRPGHMLTGRQDRQAARDIARQQSDKAFAQASQEERRRDRNRALGPARVQAQQWLERDSKARLAAARAYAPPAHLLAPAVKSRRSARNVKVPGQRSLHAWRKAWRSSQDALQTARRQHQQADRRPPLLHLPKGRLAPMRRQELDALWLHWDGPAWPKPAPLAATLAHAAPGPIGVQHDGRNASKAWLQRLRRSAPASIIWLDEGATLARGVSLRLYARPASAPCKQTGKCP